MLGTLNSYKDLWEYFQRVSLKCIVYRVVADTSLGAAFAFFCRPRGSHYGNFGIANPPSSRDRNSVVYAFTRNIWLSICFSIFE